jgi:hypothetical protein
VTAPGPTALATIVVYLAALCLWGTRLLRRLELPGQTLLTLIPLGLIVGLATQLCLSNVLSYVVRPPAAFPLALGVQALSAFALRTRAVRAAAAVPRGAIATAAILAGIVLATFAARAFTEFQQDNFREHWLDAATILDGNFPVRHPFAPDEPARYHYGTALLSAEIGWVADASILWAPQFLKTALVFACLLLVFGFVCEEHGNVSAALFAWTIFYLYVGLPELLADVSAGLGPTALLDRAAGYGQHNQFFHFPSAALFVQPIAAGWPLALGTLYLLWRRQLALDLESAAVLVLLLAALALSATPEFIATMGGIALFLGATSLGPLRRFGSARPAVLGGALAVTAVVASVQGGVLTDLWRGTAPGAPSELAIRWPPGTVVGVDQILTVGSREWFKTIVLVSDGLVLLVPLAAFVALRLPTPPTMLLLAVIATALGMSQLISYPSGEFNTNRSLAFALHMSLLLVFLRPFDAVARHAVARWAVVAVALIGCVPALLYDANAVIRAVGVGGRTEWSYLFWWDDPELLAAARWIRTVTPRGARIGTNDPMLLVALSGRFAPNSSVDTHGHVHPDGLSIDPSEWTPERLVRAQLDAICLFRSPFFEAGDVDAAAVAREIHTGGPNAALVARMLGPNAGALSSGSAKLATLALNAIVRGQPYFAKLVHLDRLAGPAPARRMLAQLRTAGADRESVHWMFLNRAALQGIFPDGTRESWSYSQGITDDYLVRYPWYDALSAWSGNGGWLTPPAGQGAGRVRCLLVAPPG